MSKSNFKRRFNLKSLNDTEVLQFLLSLGGKALDNLVQRRLSKGDDLDTALISIFEKADGIHMHPGADPEADINVDLLSIAYCGQVLFNAKSMSKINAEAYIQNFLDTTTCFKMNSLNNNTSETRH